MAEKIKKSRLMLAGVLGLEIGLLGLGIYTFLELREKGLNPVNTGQLLVLGAAMIFIYLMYLKSETMRAEQKVVGEKYRTGALLEAMPVPAMMLSAGGVVLGVNASAAELLGVDELELLTADLTETPGGELGKRLASGGAGSFEAETAAGRRLRCTSSPIAGAGESAASLVILEGFRTEESREKGKGASEEVRNLVRQCAETVAPVLERSSDHLASLATHSRMSSPHEAGRAAQLSGVAVRLLQAARRIRLAQQLTLIQNGELKATLSPEAFDCAAAARDTAERMKSVFAATGVDLDVELPEEPVQVNADRGRFSLALRDLLEVCLAMTSSGDKVNLKVVGAEGEAEITVTDTGLGMSREELDSLFSTSGGAPVHENYTGGIRDGLFVAKEIMEASGGQLWAESAPGKGTRFNLRMPTA
jgi:PAS domain-containing protein